MKIIIKTTEPEFKANELNIGLLLRDALAEFQMHRLPADTYVNRRYPNNEDYKWLDRAAKIREVNNRIRLAEVLRNAELTIEWE